MHAQSRSRRRPPSSIRAPPSSAPSTPPATAPATAALPLCSSSSSSASWRRCCSAAGCGGRKWGAELARDGGGAGGAWGAPVRWVACQPCYAACRAGWGGRKRGASWGAGDHQTYQASMHSACATTQPHPCVHKRVRILSHSTQACQGLQPTPHPNSALSPLHLTFKPSSHQTSMQAAKAQSQFSVASATRQCTTVLPSSSCTAQGHSAVCELQRGPHPLRLQPSAQHPFTSKWHACDGNTTRPCFLERHKLFAARPSQPDPRPCTLPSLPGG